MKNIKNWFVDKVKIGDKEVPSKWARIKKLMTMIFIGAVVATLGSYLLQTLIFKSADSITQAYTGGYDQINFK